MSGREAISLREGTLADLNVLYELDVLCFEPPLRFTRAAMRRFMGAAGALTLVAETSAGEPAGFLIVHFQVLRGERQAYLVTLDVDPGHRQQGIARQMMSEAELRARVVGAEAMALHVSSENPGALALYETAGYTRLMLHPDFYAPGHAAWSFQKTLP